jgi:hypothetical protein
VSFSTTRSTVSSKAHIDSWLTIDDTLIDT